MAARRDNQAIFREAFLKYRQGEYDPAVDAQLKKEGQTILEKYDPSKNKSGRINSHSVFWMIASIAVFYYTDFYVALRVDSRVNWLWMYPGIAMIAVNVTIGTVCVVWFHYIKGNSNYEESFPYIVPIATISFFCGMICCCIGLWPVWSWFTLPVLLTLFMGVVFFVTVLPI